MQGDPTRPVPLPACYVKDQNLVTRSIAGEIIIVPVTANVAQLDSIYTLNELGGLIWGMLDGGTTVHQLADAVCEAYEVTPEEAAKDLGEFLGALEAAGLIRVLPGGGSQP